MRVQGNKALRTARVLAVQLLRRFLCTEGQADPEQDGWVKVCRAELAELTGASRDAVSDQLGDLEAAGLITRRYDTAPGYVDRETGEIVGPRSEMFVRLNANSVVEAIEAAAIAVAPPRKPGQGTWGGSRIPKPKCPEHPRATVLSTTIYECSRCGKNLGDVAKMVKPQMATQHSDEQCETVQGNLPHRSRQSREDRERQVASHPVSSSRRVEVIESYAVPAAADGGPLTDLSAKQGNERPGSVVPLEAGQHDPDHEPPEGPLASLVRRQVA